MSTDEELALGAAVVAGAEKLFAIYKDAKSGSVTASQALNHIQAMLDALPSEFAADDAKADVAIDERFK